MNVSISRRKAVYLTIIAVLVVVLVLQQFLGRTVTPTIPKLKEDVTAVQIKTVTGTIDLHKDGDKWLVGKENYPGAADKINNLVQKVAEIDALEQVTSSGYFRPYQLEENEALKVSLYNGDKELRTVLIGKASSTGRQSYVRFPGKKEVLLVSENLRRDFELKTDALRLKKIFTLDPATIHRFTIVQGQGKPRGFIRAYDGWTTDDGVAADKKKISEFLRTFEAFIVSGYPEDAVDTGEQLAQITFETDGGNITVEIMSETEGGDYLGRSSETPYIFSLAHYKGQQILKSPEEFIQKDEPKSEAQ